MCAGPELKFENYESVQHRLQFSGIKKGGKISFQRHFKNLRVRKKVFSGEVYANTAKEDFSFQETDALTEQIAEAEPTLMEMTTKDATISISGTKTVSCYYTCSACGKATEPTRKLLKCGSCKLQQRITPDSKCCL